MKQFILLIVLLLMPIIGWSIPDSMLCNKGDTNYVSVRYNNGNLKLEGCICSTGLLHGKVIEYTRSGKIQFVSYYYCGNLIHFKSLYTVGKRMGQVKRINGIRLRQKEFNCTTTLESQHSTFMSAYNQFDSLGRKVGYWSEGIVEDIFLFEEGHYIAVGFYFEGQKFGKWEYFKYDTKCLYASCDYSDGVRDGLFSFYLPNGNPSVSFEFANGARTGRTFYYNLDGTIRKLVGDR